MSDRRVKVACINWGHADAPHAASYVLRNGAADALAFHPTWADAMKRADRIAARFARIAKAETEAPVREADAVRQWGADG
jgi:hypothetical protein